jgi:hypothetical protein
LAATTIYRYYQARFQIEFLFRDAKQFTGLSDCQARSQAKLHFHFGARVTAVTLAKLEARPLHNNQAAPFSMATVKRCYFNAHLIERILSTFADETRLDKQPPRNTRRNGLPVKLIDGAFLMRHEHLAGALVELRQIGKTASGPDSIFHHPPEAFDRVEVVPAMGG